MCGVLGMWVWRGNSVVELHRADSLMLVSEVRMALQAVVLAEVRQ